MREEPRLQAFCEYADKSVKCRCEFTHRFCAGEFHMHDQTIRSGVKRRTAVFAPFKREALFVFYDIAETFAFKNVASSP